MAASGSNGADRRASLTPLGNGLYRVNAMNRSAVTGRFLTEPDRVRIAAARLRITTDAKQGLTTPEPIKALAKQSIGGTVKETYSKVEIIRPDRPAAEQFGVFLASLFWLGFRVLIVWWALAAWFPQLGITYWEAILPVYAIRMLVSNQTIIGRQLTK